MYLESLKLVMGVCWENPHHIETLYTAHPAFIDYLLGLVSEAGTTPRGESLVMVLNFLHSVSLKEGKVREEKMPGALTALFENVLSVDRFEVNLEAKSLGAIFNALNKFHSNVKGIDRCLFNG